LGSPEKGRGVGADRMYSWTSFWRPNLSIRLMIGSYGLKEEEHVFFPETTSFSSSNLNSAGANLMCPHCRYKKLWRNGYRYTPFDDKIQRWPCCNCGRRFSDPQDVEKAWSTPEHFERVESKSIKSRDDKDNIHQAKQLIEDGFEYVMEKEGVSLFRKLK